jgi:MFS family permease
MLALALTNGEIGLISSIGLIFGMALSLFSGYITDRMGRRWSLLMYDMITWVVGCLLWGLAQNFAWFLAAGIANAFMRMVTVPYACVLQEETPPENRLSVYSVLNLSNTIANFCAPLMNLLINPMGLVPAMRGVLITTSVIYSITFIIRHKYIKDTAIAITRKQESKKDTPFTAIAGYKKIIKELLATKVLLVYLFMRALYFVQMNLKNTYLSVTIIQGLNFQITTMSLVSILTGVVGILAQLVIMPKLVGKDSYKPLFISLAVSGLSNLMFFLAPESNLIFLITTVVINTTGLVVISMLLETLVANALPDAHRSALLALAAVFMVILSAPFQYLGGVLADIPGIGPRLPQLIITIMTAGIFLLLLVNYKIQKADNHTKAVI